MQSFSIKSVVVMLRVRAILGNNFKTIPGTESIFKFKMIGVNEAYFV